MAKHAATLVVFGIIFVYSVVCLCIGHTSIRDAVGVYEPVGGVSSRSKHRGCWRNRSSRELEKTAVLNRGRGQQHGSKQQLFAVITTPYPSVVLSQSVQHSAC